MKKIFIILLGLIAFSCTSKKAFYEEIKQDQKNSYDNWKVCYHHECKDEIFIDGKLSLEEAVKTGLKYNKHLKATFQQKNIAQAKVYQALSLALPHILGAAAYTRLDEAPYLGSGAAKTKIGHENNYSVDLHLRQEIFKGGMIKAGIDTSKLFVLFSDEQIRKQIQNTIYLATKAYYQALFAQSLLEVNRQTVETAKAHLNEVKLKLEQGFASSYDVLRSEVEVTNFEAEMIKQENATSMAITFLLKVLGASQQSNVILSDKLEYVPFNIEYDDAIQLAFNNRPDLFASDIEKRMQNEAVKMAVGEYFPHVNTMFSHKWGRPDPHTTTIDTWGRQWNFRVALEWPLFDGLRRYGKVKQEKASLKQKEILYEDMKETVVFEVQRSHISLQDADKFVKSQQLDLTRAQKALELAKAGYQEGMKTQVEVMDAISSMTRGQSLYYNAIFLHNIAKLDLSLSMGVFNILEPGGEDIESSK